jgi:cell division septation protein DedD
MRFEYRAAGPIAAASILLLLAACSRTQQDWRVAQQAGTAQAYRVFVARHPGSELAGVARERAARLQEQAAWQQATRTNTPAAYQEYLAKYPEGSWSQDARIRMESRMMAQAPAGAAAPASAAADQPPAPVPTAAPAPGQQTAAGAIQPATSSAGADPAAPPAAAGGSAVQLGAFSTDANARSAWSRLSSTLPQLQGMTPRIVPVTSSGRRLYRLEAPVADPAAARRLCRQLQQLSRDCLPLP